jgi:dCTP deaminase
MILTDRQLKEAHEHGDIVIDPFEEDRVQPASYDLRIGEQGITTSGKKVINLRESGYLAMEPGDVSIVTVLERLQLSPLYAARLGLRSEYVRKGLVASLGLQVDPGFSGELNVTLVNLTPQSIALPYKDDFLSAEFHKLEAPATHPYKGPYQGQKGLGPEEIAAITEGGGVAFSEIITTLRSLSQNVASLSSHVRIMEWSIPTVLVIGITVIAILVGLKK